MPTNRKHHSDQQIAAILKQIDPKKRGSRKSVAARYNIHPTTISKWIATQGLPELPTKKTSTDHIKRRNGATPEPNERTRLRDENSRLRDIIIELLLDRHTIH